MTDDKSADGTQKEWLRIKDEVLQDIVNHDARAALAKLNRVIDGPVLAAEVMSDALGLRSELRLDKGDYPGARADLLLAHGLAPAGYLRYVHELSLGSVCRAEQNPSDALKWYRSALQTCVDANDVSGGTALKRFVELVGDHISPEDMALCRAAIKRSWLVLGLPGEAETHDLAAAIVRLKREETEPRS